MTNKRVKLSEVQQLDLPQANQAHLWLCRLNESGDCIEKCSSLLSLEESKRAGQYIVEQARNRYIVSRGVLRCLLSGYLSTPATAIDITIDPLGKPRVSGITLQFNLAHSGEWLIVAFAVENEVGIDIERYRPVRNWQSIAARHYSSNELAAFPKASDEYPPELFFRLWTRKEAILKWHGTGMHTPLSSFDVPTDEQCSAWIKLPTVQSRCWVQSLNAPSRYSAALATTNVCTEIVVKEII